MFLQPYVKGGGWSLTCADCALFRVFRFYSLIGSVFEKEEKKIQETSRQLEVFTKVDSMEKHDKHGLGHSFEMIFLLFFHIVFKTCMCQICVLISFITSV